jgi:hypothetical protein
MDNRVTRCELIQVLAKDANINVQALSAKCLLGLAIGLRKKFAPFVSSVWR